MKAGDVLGTAEATRFEQAISKSRLVWIGEAAYVPHFDQPQAVADHLSFFVRHAGIDGRILASDNTWQCNQLVLLLAGKWVIDHPFPCC